MWFEEFSDQGPHRLFVAERSAEVVGFAHSRSFRAKAAYSTSVETTVYVAPGALGAGVGSALYARLLATIDEAGVHRADAGIALPNAASIELHTRSGYREAGTFGEVGWKFDRFWDVCWYERSGGSRGILPG